MEVGILFLLLIGWQIYKASMKSREAQAGNAEKAPPLVRDAPSAKNPLNDRLSSFSQKAGMTGKPSFDQKSARLSYDKRPAFEKEDYFALTRRRSERRDRPHKNDDPEKIDLFEVRPRLFH